MNTEFFHYFNWRTKRMKKKIIIAIIIAAVVAAAGIGAYFLFGSGDSGSGKEVSAVKEDFVQGAGIIEAYSMNPDRFKKSLVNEYQMGEETAAKFFEAPSEWLAFDQMINIKNTGDTNITVYGFEVKDNGKDGVYIGTSLGGALSIAPGATVPTSFSILSSQILMSDDEIHALVDKMEISIVYSETPEEYDDGTESVEETKTAPIEAPAEK